MARLCVPGPRFSRVVANSHVHEPWMWSTVIGCRRAPVVVTTTSIQKGEAYLDLGCRIVVNLPGGSTPIIKAFLPPLHHRNLLLGQPVQRIDPPIYLRLQLDRVGIGVCGFGLHDASSQVAELPLVG